MSEKRKLSRRYAVCITNKGNEASLERNKLYVLLPDRQAEADGLVRVKIDPFTKSCFFYLFIFAIGYKVGPQFFQGLRGEGLQQAALCGEDIDGVVGEGAVIVGAVAYAGDVALAGDDAF